MLNKMIYKGEEVPKIYEPWAGAKYAVFRRKSLHAAYLVYREDGDLITLCEYCKGAKSVCEELNVLINALIHAHTNYQQ